MALLILGPVVPMSIQLKRPYRHGHTFALAVLQVPQSVPNRELFSPVPLS